MGLSFSRDVLFATTALLLTCSTIWAGPADDLIKKGNDLDLKLQASEALSFYLAAEKLEPKNANVLVRIARQYRHLMADAITREEKLRLGGISLDYALRAAALAPNDSEAQLSPAICYGKLVPLQSQPSDALYRAWTDLRTDGESRRRAPIHCKGVGDAGRRER
jgi:hypothetical protein